MAILGTSPLYIGGRLKESSNCPLFCNYNINAKIDGNWRIPRAKIRGQLQSPQRVYLNSDLKLWSKRRNNSK
jgi:hypothetical protein